MLDFLGVGASGGRVAAEVWCYPNTNVTWLERAPTILLEKGHRPRDPYPLDAAEQELLLHRLIGSWWTGVPPPPHCSV